jgi:ABC-2 type transport system permease protein
MSARGVGVMVWQTLRLRRFTLLAWSLALAGLVITYVALFPSIEKLDLGTMLEQYPEELMRAFGFDEMTQLNTAIGFLNTELFGFMLPLAIVFLPVGVIVRMTARAEESGYLDALFSAPLARWQLMAASALAATVAMAIPLLVTVITALLSAEIVGVELTLSQIGGSALSLLPMGALAGSLAVLVVGLTPRHAVATAVAVGTIVVMYLLNVLVGLIAWVDDIKWMTLFHYYSTWINEGIQWPAYLAWSAIALLITVVGCLLYERRDLD